MKVTLIHNPSAGKASRSDADDLAALIRAAGHQVAYQSVKEENWQAALEKPADVVAVAGGDGTVGDVARRLLGKSIPIAVVPRGTANNLAHTLKVTHIPLDQLIAGWTAARYLPFDSAIANGPWGQDHFFESLGTGFFAWTIAQIDREDGSAESGSKDMEHELRAARRFLRERLDHFSPQSLQVKLDGRDLSGEFLLLEAMNIRSIGPNLFLAPGADPGDGLLDVVLIPSEEQDKLREHLRDQTEDNLGDPCLTLHRGKHLQVQGEGGEFHLDDRSWPDDRKASAQRPFSVEVRVNPKTLMFLVPP
jgi:diacylglycerol kinase (ATP)